uniref:site-specific DNA-methyltransferase (adenine-specific) n=1 Tax=viral metagenome TaxID=1070528 RepID=A0A6C0EB34_9ZZZZ
MNIRDFIDYIITFNNVDDILDTCKSQSKKGFIFERLFDIFIKFGFCDRFPNSKFNHMIGNSNNGKLKILKNLDMYLSEKVLSGNSGGCSDITLQNKDDDMYIFISSKYLESNEDMKEQKSVDHYGIQNILAMTTENKHIYKKYKIYLVVSNRKKVLDKVKSANKSSKYITEHMTMDNILDKTDLNKYFLAFKQDIIKNKNEDWQTIYLNNKENLILRFHQELITLKTSNLIEEDNKSFLWGCKCRSGKTYMFGGIIIKQFKIKNKLNVLIVTPAPTETAPQFTSDLFNRFKDFDKFKIHHIEGSKMINDIETDDNNIFVMSKQLLQKYINDKTIMKIKNLKLDIIGFDENHFSGTTNLSKDILTSYSSKNTIKIYLTATYNKPLKEWNILPECQMFWDIEDEQICKSILTNENNLDRLKEKHGSEYIIKTIKYYNDLGLSINEMFKCYKKMPDLHLITNLFDRHRYEIIKEKLNNENKMGFCFDTLFGLNKAKTKFSFENEVKTFLRYISGSNREEDGEKTIFTRINKICSEKETRLPFTQIWFLPSDNINEISKCLKTLMFEDDVLKKYIVLCINRKNKDLAKDIKDEINRTEIEAKSKGRLGVILLAGNMLTLGITLNKCDMVILMNNALSSDKVLQQMYRCMTEAENKNIGFVVDLNISRVLNTCVNYTIYKNEKSIDDKMKYLIKNHLINIDVDMMENKKINSDTIVKKLMDIWKEDPINSFRTLLRKLDNDYEEFDNSTQKLINKTFTKSLKDDKVSLKLKLKDEDDEIQDLPSGKEKVKNDSDNEHSDNDSSDEEEKDETQISFTKDVLPYVIPLTCMLTIKNSNMDFVKMLNDIKENPELLDTFDDQCLIWWNKKHLIDLIRDIVSKYFDKGSNTYNISVQFKMSLQSLIDNPKELLELINDCLKPKAVEKKENGEVFTPIILVNEMLDKLPKEIWKNKNLKWLDPAAGMGNFPIAIYLRLMEGLKYEIKDVKVRKKHILENMLYMCELNKKNVLVCNQIFDINNEYELNLYEGDTLEFNPKKAFDVKQFDIIIGNPPYNKGGIRSHTGKQLGEKNETIWTKFIEKAFKWLKPNGHLAYINPLSWLKKSHPLHNTLLEKHIIWMKLWDNSQSKGMINADIPISLYVLQNSLNIDKKKTEITSILRRRNLTTTSNEYLNKDYSIPLAYHSIFNKLMRFIETRNLKLEYSTKTVKSTGTKTKIPSKYKLKDMLAVDTYTIKEGIMIKKTTEMHPDADKRKLIIANKASFNGAFIDDGKLSLTGNHKFYILGDDLELILKMLKYKIIDIISHYTKYGQDFLDNEAFTYLPDIRKLGTKDIDEKQFYKLIGLTQDEIKLFDKNIIINDTNNQTDDIRTVPKKKPSKKNIIIDDSDDSDDDSNKTKKKVIKKNRIKKNNNDF